MSINVNPAVGIDLGTTNTVVATQTETTGAELLYIAQPVHERNVLDVQPWVKSAVFFETANSAVVGAFAAHRLDAFRSIKSKMGTRWRIAHPCSQMDFVQSSYVSGHILKAAFDALVARFPSWDRKAIVTVPASFNTDQRRDTLAAAHLAGFSEVNLLDEPTAAFYYYFDQHRDELDVDQPKQILVFDFGGGTLDVSIIEVTRKAHGIIIDAIGRSRYNNLGGDDIDLDIATFMLGCWEFRFGSEITSLPKQLRARMFQLFIEKARFFKEEVEDYLSQGLEPPEFVINEEVTDGSNIQQVDLHLALSRAIYDEITNRFFQEKQEVNIFRPIGQALEIAQRIRPAFSREKLDFILYTGGASRMSAVKSSLECFFAPTPCFSLSDEEACNTVALGAAGCRFDEIHRHQQVAMTARMLESLLTRSDDGLSYITLVPIDCEPSDHFSRVDHEFRTQRSIIKLKLPLFRGTGPHDPQLNPIRDLEVRLDRIVERDIPYFNCRARLSGGSSRRRA